LLSNLRGGGSYLIDVHRTLEAEDSMEFTRLLDMRCRGLRAQGLARWDKCRLDSVSDFNKEYVVEPGSSSDKLFHAIAKFSGGSELGQWVHEKLWRKERLLPPKKYTDLAQRHFDWLDADSSSLAIQTTDDNNEEEEEEEINTGWPPHCEVEVFLSPEDDVDGEEDIWAELCGKPAGEWVHYNTHFVEVGVGENEGMVLVLDKNEMSADWFEADKVRVKLSTPARVLTSERSKSRSTRGSRSPAGSPGSQQVGPVCPRGLLTEKVFDRVRDAEWFCIVVYARLSEDAQDLDKFLCDIFLEKIKDATVQEACWHMSGGCFTEAYITWVVLVRLFYFSQTRVGNTQA